MYFSKHHGHGDKALAGSIMQLPSDLAPLFILQIQQSAGQPSDSFFSSFALRYVYTHRQDTSFADLNQLCGVQFSADVARLFSKLYLAINDLAIRSDFFSNRGPVGWVYPQAQLKGSATKKLLACKTCVEFKTPVEV